MKLYFSPGACSLADRIALIESGLAYETEHVDLERQITAGGADYRQINPKGYVPALELDDGEILTENIAILSYIAAESGWLSPPDGPGHWRVLEMTTYISTEIHKAFTPLWSDGASQAEQDRARATITARLALLSEQMGVSPCLFGQHPMIADCYLFVMLLWARDKAGIALPARLDAYFNHLSQHPSVRQAMEEEGLAHGPDGL